VRYRPTPPGPGTASFEDWLITQTFTPHPRGRIAQLMLDQRLHKVDFGAAAVRTEFRRMLDDFESATRGVWVASTPLPLRSPCSGRPPVPDLPEEA
jgi:hypothetical protein